MNTLKYNKQKLQKGKKIYIKPIKVNINYDKINRELLILILYNYVDKDSVNIIISYFESYDLENDITYYTKDKLMKCYNNDWRKISAHNNLSEDFIIEFSEYINWEIYLNIKD